ncbi:MAG: glycosyltransferase family 2 protein [Candidatus Staskawiczbacteria bacterium]|nr:glycosyltransferase family 2 protein [Candidatus Staskawiczbacteria bacterium]
MENQKLLVSIITPTFNRGKFLEQNIISIKNQDYPFIEHIVIDGGSTDNSLEILKKYEGTYNLKWISEKDNGCADAMNKGFERASGQIFCWLDSDDFYLPCAIKKIAEVFKNNLNVDAVFGDVLLGTVEGKIIGYTKYTSFNAETSIYLGMVVATQSTFWRSTLHRKINGLDAKYLRCADLDFFTRMAISGAKFRHVRNFLSVYRYHPGQLTQSVDLCEKEKKEIFQKYSDNKLNARGLKLKRMKLLLERAVNFIKQGDIWYVFKGILRRFDFLYAVNK